MDDDVRPRIRLLDGVFLITACAVASFFVRDAVRQPWSKEPALLLLSILTFLAASVILSHFFILLHHKLIDGRDLEFCGTLSLVSTSALALPVLTAILMPPVVALSVLITLLSVPTCAILALMTFIASIFSRELRRHLDWLDYYSLTAAIFGGLWMLALFNGLGYIMD